MDLLRILSISIFKHKLIPVNLTKKDNANFDYIDLFIIIANK